MLLSIWRRHLTKVMREVVKWALRKLLAKGLKVNAGKSKVIVGSNIVKMIVNHENWSCGVCGNRVQEKS